MTLEFSGANGPKSATARGLRFNYLEWGTRDAPVLVLLHALTVHAHSWDFLAQRIQDHFRVIALDQRGHGDTQWPDPPAYRTCDYVEDLEALATLWGLERFALLGHSMGGHNALSYAATVPHRVEKLIVVDSAPSSHWAEGAPPPDPTPTEGASIEEMVEQACLANPRASAELLGYRVEKNLRQRSDGRFAVKYSLDAWREWKPEDLRPKLSSIRAPTLVIRGGESPVLGEETAAGMIAGLPNARLLAIEGAGHTIPLDKPTEFEAAVTEFLAE